MNVKMNLLNKIKRAHRFKKTFTSFGIQCDVQKYYTQQYTESNRRKALKLHYRTEK